MRIPLALVALLLSAGCGPSIDLKGTWNGTWSAVMLDGSIQGGGLHLVANRTKVAGYGNNAQLRSGDFNVAGEVDGFDVADILYTYPGAGTYRCKGQLELLVGHLIGNFDLTFTGRHAGTSSVDLVKDPAG